MPTVLTQPTRWVVNGSYMEIKAGTRVERVRKLDESTMDAHRYGLILGAIQQAARHDITLVPVILAGAVRLLPEGLLREVR